MECEPQARPDKARRIYFQAHMAPLIPLSRTITRGIEESVGHALLFGCEKPDERCVT